MISIEKNKAINEALNRICQHELFVRSSTYSRLLRYLVEKALAQEDLKEYTIGADLFGENYTDNKNDGTVRSKMYKLRKKLSRYYDNEGSKEEVIFHIEKGQYNLSFEEPDIAPLNTKDFQLSVSRKALLVTSISILVLASLILTIRFQSKYSSSLWNPFIQKNAKNVVVVSDHYVVNERLHNKGYHAVLFPDIKNSSELYSYKQTHPNRVLSSTDYTLMTKMGPFGIKAISRWLFSHDKDYDIRLESELSPQDVSENNLIFIGQFKSMNLSQSLFLKHSKVFTTHLDGFKHIDKGVSTIYNTKFKPNSRTEYAMVSYASLSEGKTAVYFVSNNDIGVLATLNRFTDKAWLKSFEQKLPKDATGFSALFEVSGLQRSVVNCELVELEILTD